MIEDFIKIIYGKTFTKEINDDEFKKIKAELKQKGYEVEEKISKLEEAREAIKELQEQINKMKCCENCVHNGTGDPECSPCDYCLNNWELAE
jgi:hypothetical protein